MRIVKAILPLIAALGFCFSQNTTSAQSIQSQKTSNTTISAGFIQEKGQFKTFEDLKFHWFGKNVFVYMLSDRLVFITKEVTYKDNEKSQAAKEKGDDNLAKKLSAITTAHRFDLLFVNSNKDVTINGESQQNVQRDYYLGHCPDGILNVPTFDKVRYSNLYPNIDMIFYTDGNGIKYEFEVKRGGDPSAIKLQWAGVENLNIAKNNDLQFSNGSFDFTDKAPISKCGEKQISTRYNLNENNIGFTVSDYNHNETLIIDPALTWASSLQYNGYGSWGSLVTNSTGQFYIVDWEWDPGAADVVSYLSSAGSSNTYSTDVGNTDIIISKFSKGGSLLWACRYGGAGDDDVNGGVALDDNDNLFVAGTSGKEFSSPSGDFPIVNWPGAFNQAWDGSLSTGMRGYLIKFLANNTRQWSTYLDKGANLEVFDISCGQNNSIYMTGTSGGSPTYSTGIPSGTGYLGALNGNNTSHSFILEFNSSGALYWATWLPGVTASTGTGRSSEIAVNKTSGYFYVVGDDMWSFSTRFSTALITATYTNMGQSDLFFMQFNSSNQPVPAYGKYIGGAGFDKINIGAANGDIEVDASDNLYACGHTYSANFPLVNPGTCAYYDGTIKDGTGIVSNVAPNQDGYLVKLNSSGTLVLSTFFGGTNYTSMKRIKKDTHGNLWICGEQSAAGLATVTHADYFNQTITGTNTNIMFAQLGSNDNLEWLSYYGFSGYSGYNGFDQWEPTSDSSYLFLSGNFNVVSNTGGGYQYVSASSCSGAAEFRNYLSSNAPFTISGASSICAGNTTTWSSTSPGGSWSSSQPSVATINSSSGLINGVSGGTTIITYSLTISSCVYSVSDTLIVTMSSSVASVTGTSPLCVGGTSTYTANSVVLGSGTGTWSSSNNSVASVDAAGLVTANGPGSCNIIYTITGGCNGTVSSQQSITVNSVSTAPTAISATANPICSGDPTTLSVVGGSLGTGASWQWFSGACSGTAAGSGTSISVSPGANTTYYVLAQGSCNTTVCASLLVTVNSNADATILSTSDVCVSDAAFTLSATDAGGSWSGTGITNASTGLFNPATAGVGSHQIIYTISGSCGDADTIMLNVVALINADITPDGPFCVSEAATTLTAANPGGSWSGTGITNAATGLFDPATAGLGDHEIIYTISGSCGNADTITISVVSSLDASISAAGPYCINAGSATLNAANAGGTWSGTGILNASTGLFDPATAGVGPHEIIYTISGACGDADTATILVNPKPSSTTSAAAESCQGAFDGTASAIPTGGTSPYTYLWSNGASTSSILALAPDLYTVVITDANNCFTTDSAVVLASSIACETVVPVVYVPNIFTPNGDGVNDVLYVRGQGILAFTLRIYDRWGEKVFETSDLNIGWDGTFRNKKMDNAVFVYYLHVEFTDATVKDDKGSITMTR